MLDVAAHSDVSQGNAAARLPEAVRPSERFLVPLLTVRQESVLRVIVLGWFTATVYFWIWWLSPGRGSWSAERGIATACLGWLFLLAAYFLYFACRMTRPNPRLPVPSVRVAMVVTKAPSEPWALVVRTLKAMLAQDFPYDYDVWLADERPTGKSLRWCRGHGVRVSSRYGVPEYHQPDWPRRTKCKEGNLAYFYDQVGYESYDVVAQLDADHVPTASYLQAVVRPFIDPGVGYVAAPSLCDANAEKGWTVRGRLHKEASTHGPVQAGCNGGGAPVCIGSHYAVRTQALRAVGGLGPDLAEDYSTTLWLQSGGWAGVFAIDAEAHGDGPETLEDMLVQELQWARSLGTILTRWARPRLRSVPWRARVRLWFALVFYPIQGLVCVVATALPAIGITTGRTWGNSSLLGFYLHIWSCSIMLVLALAWLRRCGVLRPVRAKLWSLDLLLFQLIRWPWATWGFFQGMWEGVRGPAKSFKITPKGVRTSRPLDPVLVYPPLALALFAALAMLLVGDPRPTLGLYVLTLLQVLSYLAVSCLVVLLHIRAAPAGSGGRPWARGRHGQLRLLLRLSWSDGGSAAAVVTGFTVVIIGALVIKLASLQLVLV